MVTTLIVVISDIGDTYVESYQIYHLKYVLLFYVNYTSIKNKRKKTQNIKTNNIALASQIYLFMNICITYQLTVGTWSSIPNLRIAIITKNMKV